MYNTHAHFTMQKLYMFSSKSAYTVYMKCIIFALFASTSHVMSCICFSEPVPPPIDSWSCGMVPVASMESLDKPMECLSPVSMVQLDIPKSNEFRRTNAETEVNRYVKYCLNVCCYMYNVVLS